MASKIMTISENILKLGLSLGKNQSRGILGSISNRNFQYSESSAKKKSFDEKKLVGFSMEQMYDVVADVENYNKFVPFCKKSYVHSKGKNSSKADLIIGFPPITESYTSHITFDKPNIVRAECMDGKLFNYLLTVWKFSPGLKDVPQSCVIDFQVAFEFKSILHSQVALFFFDQLVKQMEEAFFTQASYRFGPPVIKSLILRANKS